jgi:hypothetical protein
MRTTITIDDGILEEVKQAAGDSGRTLSGFIQDAVAAALHKDSPAARPFRLVTFGRGGTWPAVDLDRTSALLQEDDIAPFAAHHGRP